METTGIIVEKQKKEIETMLKRVNKIAKRDT